MISVKTKGDFSNLEKYLKRVKKLDLMPIFDKYGSKGVSLLSKATPKDSGETAASWDYKVSGKNGRYKLEFINSHEVDGVNIAIILQYGHGTRGGTYVEGIDYISPVIQPLFKDLADELIKEVRRS